MNKYEISGLIFWIGLSGSPIITYFIIRKIKMSSGLKSLLGLIIIIALGIIFYLFAIGIAFRNGYEPL